MDRLGLLGGVLDRHCSRNVDCAMTTPITVVIPVGPEPKDCAYIREAVASVAAQTAECGLLLVDDMHGRHRDCPMLVDDMSDLDYDTVENPWHGGVAFSFNHGVAQAWTEHVLLLGADDVLQPHAIEIAQRAIEARPTEQAYYWFDIRYMDDRPEPLQGQPCGAAVVTKKLWEKTGGFPVESAVGRSDVMLVGLLLGHPDIGTLIPVGTWDGEPQYWVRVHDGQHTASRGPWVRALEETANAFWATWESPRWGRYE